MNNTSSFRTILRRVIPIVLVGLVVVIALAAFYRLLMQPRLVITAPAGSRITVKALHGNKTIATAVAKNTTTTVPVVTGDYVVVIAHQTSKQLSYGSIGFFQKHTYHLSATPLHTALVAQQTAFAAVGSGDAVQYLDTTKRAVISLDQSGVLTALDNRNQLVGSLGHDNPGNAAGMHPLADGQAIVLSGNTLYALRDNTLTPLQTKGFPAAIRTLAIGTNQRQSSFVVLANTTLFWYGSPSAAPQKIRDVGKQADEVAYGGQRVIVYSTRMPEAVEDIKASYTSLYAIDPILVDISSKTQATLTSGPIVDASVSPDGRLATVQEQGNAYSSLYDLAAKRIRYDLTDNFLTTPVWSDATHLVYGAGTDIWQLDTQTKSAAVLGELPGDLQPTSITYDQQHASYLVTSYNSASSAAIFRLSGTAVSQTAARAAALLTTTHITSSQFTMSYVDVAQPTIYITTNVVLNDPTGSAFKTATLQARQTALGYLVSQGIDPNKLHIVYNPANP